MPELASLFKLLLLMLFRGVSVEFWWGLFADMVARGLRVLMPLLLLYDSIFLRGPSAFVQYAIVTTGVNAGAP